jgi:hypothetical protein
LEATSFTLKEEDPEKENTKRSRDGEEVKGYYFLAFGFENFT